jgi:hypothetical protein
VTEPKAALLADALRATTGDRQGQYGPPAVNLEERTARLFTAYLADLGVKRPLDGRDVCNLMMLVKIARLQQSDSLPTQRDTFLDIAGYAAAGWECVTDEPRPH